MLFNRKKIKNMGLNESVHTGSTQKPLKTNVESGKAFSGSVSLITPLQPVHT